LSDNLAVALSPMLLALAMVTAVGVVAWRRRR